MCVEVRIEHTKTGRMTPPTLLLYKYIVIYLLLIQFGAVRPAWSSPHKLHFVRKGE